MLWKKLDPVLIKAPKLVKRRRDPEVQLHEMGVYWPPFFYIYIFYFILFIFSSCISEGGHQTYFDNQKREQTASFVRTGQRVVMQVSKSEREESDGEQGGAGGKQQATKLSV